MGKYFFYTVIRPFLSSTGSLWSCTGLQRTFFLMPLKLLSYVKHPQDRILLTEQIKWTGFYMRGILVVINPRKWFVKDSHYNVKSVQIRNLFWSVFSHIGNEYADLQSKSLCSVQIQENKDKNKLCILTFYTQWSLKVPHNLINISVWHTANIEFVLTLSINVIPEGK